MKAPTKEMGLALLAIYLAEEEIAVCSFERCTHPGGIFNDTIWRKADRHFAVFRRARQALGLEAFRHHDAEFGHADGRLREFRAKERALLKRERK